MRSHWLVDACIVILVGLCSSIDASPQHGKGHGKNKTVGDEVRETLPESEPVFTVEERLVIHSWAQNGRSGLPPGLAKRDQLPPGLQKHLQKHGTLPPGLQKKVQPLPVALERQLHVLPTGYRRVVIGGNIILMNEKTALIYDIVRDVIP